MSLAWTFLGVPFSTLVPLGAALGVATVLLYVLRLRRRPLIVPFAPLWEKQLGNKYASRLRSRLRRLLSLLIQLVLLLALLLSLADPRPDSYAQPARSTVLLVDVSASMSAWTQRGESRRIDAAKERIQRFFEQMGPRDEVLLVELSQRPRPLSAWSRPNEELTDLVTDLIARDTTTDLETGLTIARDALSSRQDGDVVIVGDGAFPPLDQGSLDEIEVRFASIADAPKDARPRNGQGNAPPIHSSQDETPPGNVGISALAARRYPLDPSRFEVLLEIANTGPARAEVEVALHRTNPDMSRGDVVDVLRMDMGGNSRTTRVITDLSATQHGIIGVARRLDGGENWLPSDDVAHALLTERPPVRVLVVGEENTFLDATLLVDPSLDVTRIEATDYPPTENYDLVIFDGAFPPRSPNTGAALYLGSPTPEADNYPVETGRQLEMFGFDRWEEDSIVFRFIDPYDVQVLQGRALKPAGGDEVLGYSGQQPILVSGSRVEGRFLALSFDPRKSDFVLRAAWPLFIQNALFELSPETSADQTQSITCGVPWHIKTSSPDGFAQLVGPLAKAEKNTRRLAIKGGQVTINPSLAGFYRLSDEKNSTRVFAANFFDEAEAQRPPRNQLMLKNGSTVASDASTRPPPRTWLDEILGSSPQSSIQPWMWLLLLVATISFSEWWTYHRRWTV